MPKITKTLPMYCKPKATNQAVVTTGGRDHDLGRYGTQASKMLKAGWSVRAYPNRRLTHSGHRVFRGISACPAKGYPSLDRFWLALLLEASQTVAVWRFGPQ